MYGSMTVSGLPASGVGAMAYAAAGPMEAVYAALATFTILMAAKAVMKIAPKRGV